MESNKDDARRAKEVAEKKFEDSDLAGAKKFALKAQQMYPSLEGLTHLIAVIDVHIAAADVNLSSIPNWYAILQVSSAADETAIKKQYRRLALLLHPDKNKSVGAEAAFKLIGEASRLLSNPTNRAAYDRNQNRDPPSAFWTLCPSCNIRLQFHTAYINCYLICPQCAIPFVAVPTAAPAPHPARHKGKRNKKENQMPAGNKDQAPSKPRPFKDKGTEDDMPTYSNGQEATKRQPFQEKEKESNIPAQKKDRAATKPQPSQDKKGKTPAHKKDRAATKSQSPKDKDKETQMPACNTDQAATNPQPPKAMESQMPACNKDQAATKPQPPKAKENQMPACNKDQAATEFQPARDNCRPTQKNDQAAEKPQPTKEKESNRPAHNKDRASRRSQPSKDNHMPTHNKDQAATKPQPPKEKGNAKKREGKKDVKFDKTAFDRLFAGVGRRTPLDEQSNKRAKIQVN
ncbi:hypothetical protein SUGI_0054790 [Cryptomeria japonica]|uniref:uncharacterized protein LOC131065205 n=1 Tax=Cryptomeria japonica TaxID=3369 RepID=UPI002408D695|nr:uncharacterized protein LOC131065205 [Cryptomeria japonica]GLJ06983.1 hypothetical protein SUGI_0054790 [Cryptomeria japonica]